MNIGSKDIYWNYISTFLKISSYLILLPLIINKFPSELVGVWSVFMAINSISVLLDFGFNASFTRSVSFVYSGVESLSKQGHSQINSSKDISFELLSNLIDTMKLFYRWISIVILIILITIGSVYVDDLAQKYHGNSLDIWVPWFVFCLLNAYSIHSVYIEVLMVGSGQIKNQKIYSAIGSFFLISITYVLVYLELKLIGVIIGQFISIFISRYLSSKKYFSHDLLGKLIPTTYETRSQIIKTLLPNSIKTGITSIGGFFIQKSSIFVGAVYLSLSEVASFGVVFQIVSVISALAGIFLNSYIPKITSLRVNNQMLNIWRIYKKGIFISLITYLVAGLLLIFLGSKIFSLFTSTNYFPSTVFVVLFLILSFIETIINLSGMVLLTKNEVPFFWASVISGISVVILLIVLFECTQLGVYVLIISPLLVNLSYQAWKWPLYLKKSINKYVS